jgi:hypothetical protein
MRFEDDTDTPLLEPFPTSDDVIRGNLVHFQTGYLDGSKSAQFLARRRELACYPPTAERVISWKSISRILDKPAQRSPRTPITAGI